MPSHYLNQSWYIVNWTLRNKLQWNLNRNSYIFIQENAFENIVWKMASILPRPQCVKTCSFVVISVSVGGPAPSGTVTIKFGTLVSMWWTFEGINTMRLRQHGHHIPDDILKQIFINENIWISIEISLKFVPMYPINNIPALVQIMVWRRPVKPSSEPMMVILLMHICVTRPQWVKLRSYQVILWYHLWTCWPTLDWEMTDSTKPLPDPVLDYCQHDHPEHLQWQ